MLQLSSDAAGSILEPEAVDGVDGVREEHGRRLVAGELSHGPRAVLLATCDSPQLSASGSVICQKRGGGGLAEDMLLILARVAAREVDLLHVEVLRGRALLRVVDPVRGTGLQGTSVLKRELWRDGYKVDLQSLAEAVLARAATPRSWEGRMLTSKVADADLEIFKACGEVAAER